MAQLERSPSPSPLPGTEQEEPKGEKHDMKSLSRRAVNVLFRHKSTGKPMNLERIVSRAVAIDNVQID